MKYKVTVYEWIVKDKHAKPVEEKTFSSKEQDEFLLYLINHIDTKHECCVDAYK